MSEEIKVEDGHLKIHLHDIFQNMNEEGRAAFIRNLGLTEAIITQVVDYICDDEKEGAWTSGADDIRQKILERVERKHIAELTRYLSYSWSPWHSIQSALKDIRSKGHIYWALHHSNDEWTRANAHEFFTRNRIESDYTTEQADDDIKRIENLIRETFASMTAANDVDKK